MLSRNAVIVFAVVVAEFVVFSRLIDAFGFGPVLLASLILAAVGVVLVRRSLSQIPQAMQRLVSAESDGGFDRLGLSTLGAMGLIIPGFVTAVLGALLFTPPVRALVAPALKRYLPDLTIGGAAPSDLFERMRHAERRAGHDVVDVDLVDDHTNNAPDAGPDRATRPELH